MEYTNPNEANLEREGEGEGEKRLKQKGGKSGGEKRTENFLILLSFSIKHQ